LGGIGSSLEIYYQLLDRRADASLFDEGSIGVGRNDEPRRHREPGAAKLPKVGTVASGSVDIAAG